MYVQVCNLCNLETWAGYRRFRTLAPPPTPQKICPLRLKIVNLTRHLLQHSCLCPQQAGLYDKTYFQHKATAACNKKRLTLTDSFAAGKPKKLKSFLVKYLYNDDDEDEDEVMHLIGKILNIIKLNQLCSHHTHSAGYSARSWGRKASTLSVLSVI